MTHVTLTIGGVSRRYWLALPPAVGARPPLVVFLHGTGGTAQWADNETGWSRFLAPLGVPLALPDGLPPDPRRPSKFLTNPPRWNDGSRPPGHPLASDADDIGFLDALLDDAIDRTGADPARVLLCGFSNGAGMAFRYAAERPERLAAVVPVSGYNPVANPALRRPVPTLVIHGGADPLVPFGGGPVRTPWGETVERPAVLPNLAAWARALGCDPTPVLESENGGVRTERFPAPAEGPAFRLVTVAGLGHHWPGGKGLLGEALGGPADAGGLDGAAAAWEFFASVKTEHEA